MGHVITGHYGPSGGFQNVKKCLQNVKFALIYYQKCTQKGLQNAKIRVLAPNRKKLKSYIGGFVNNVLNPTANWNDRSNGFHDLRKRFRPRLRRTF